MDQITEYRRAVRDALISAYREWLLETVKTLAILNSAGLAGVAAIFASDNAAKTFLGNYPSGAFFAVGLTCACLDMYFNARGFLARHLEVHARIENMYERTIEPSHALSPAVGGKGWFHAASVVGWSSGVMFLIGAWPFVRPAFAQIARIFCGN